MIRGSLTVLIAAAVAGCAGTPTDAGTLPGSPVLPEKFGEWSALDRDGNTVRYVRSKDEPAVMVTLRVFQTSSEAGEHVHARLAQINASYALHEGEVDDLGKYYAFGDACGYRGAIYRRKNAVVHVSFPDAGLPDHTCEELLGNLVRSTASWGQ